MRWSYGWLILAIGTIGALVFFSIYFYLKQNKLLLDYSKLLLLITFLFHYVFRVLHLQFGYVFTFLTQAALVGFLILYIREKLFPNTENFQNDSSLPTSWTKNFNYLPYSLPTICIAVGALFKILHWEFGFINGTILLVIGLLLGVASISVDPKDAES